MPVGAKITLNFAGGVALALAVSVMTAAATSAAQKDPANAKRSYNVIFLICDQESYHLRAKGDYELPARKALERRGVTFRNHYIGSAVCTPSRALFFTGLPPQSNGVYDHLAYGYVPSLEIGRASCRGRVE